MKTRLVPLYFMSGRNNELDQQLETLKPMLAEVAEFSNPVVPLGSDLPEADAVVFPQLLGDAFKQIDDLRKIHLPLVVVTSEFGTVAMWNWGKPPSKYRIRNHRMPGKTETLKRKGFLSKR